MYHSVESRVHIVETEETPVVNVDIASIIVSQVHNPSSIDESTWLSWRCLGMHAGDGLRPGRCGTHPMFGRRRV